MSSSTSQVEHVVRVFNFLPRSPRVPAGTVPNHWHVSLRHVPLSPPGDLLFIVNPDSHYVRTSRPIGVADLTSPEATEKIAKTLLDLFVTMGVDAGMVRGWRPWSWSTDDEAMGTRIVEKLREMGVDEEGLLKMETASNETNQACLEDWNRFLETLVRTVGN